MTPAKLLPNPDSYLPTVIDEQTLEPVKQGQIAPHFQYLHETLEVLARAHLRDCKLFAAYQYIPTPANSKRPLYDRVKRELIAATNELYGLNRGADGVGEPWAKPAKVIEVRPKAKP